jgi:hypothetical protein
VTYRERQRLADIQAAIDAIRSHLQRGDPLCRARPQAGGRRCWTGDGKRPELPDPEVPERTRRRSFTAQCKLDVVAEYDAPTTGEEGAVLRREELYSSHVIEWRQPHRRSRTWRHLRRWQRARRDRRSVPASWLPGGIAAGQADEPVEQRSGLWHGYRRAEQPFARHNPAR